MRRLALPTSWNLIRTLYLSTWSFSHHLVMHCCAFDFVGVGPSRLYSLTPLGEADVHTRTNLSEAALGLPYEASLGSCACLGGRLLGDCAVEHPVRQVAGAARLPHVPSHTCGAVCRSLLWDLSALIRACESQICHQLRVLR